MDHVRFSEQMAANARRIQSLIRDVSEQQARWRPRPGSWSILEVINHLWDEEKEDFRVRIEYTLHRPEEPWPPIDPGGWVVSRKYNDRDLQESLEGFLSAREESLAWLRELVAPNWDATFAAPWGSITAGDLFTSWVVHDLLHMRQLVELHWSFTTAELAPFSGEYAGDW